MKVSYLLRLDDASETMDLKKWERFEILLLSHGIKPLIAVIPNNMDLGLRSGSYDPGIWSHLKDLEKAGWEICMHGNTHIYHNESGGINPVQNRSEFAGLPFEMQCEEIRKGFRKFLEMNFQPRIFTAPSHTFDENTLLALKKETPIRIISDTIAFKPYRTDDFVFIPQQFGKVRRIYFPGLYTFSCHPGTMDNSDFEKFKKFLKLNSDSFVSVSDLDLTDTKSKSFADRAYSFLYFNFRKIFR